MSNKLKRSCNDDTLKDLRWLSFAQRCQYHTGLMVYKAKAHLTPEYINNILTFSENDTYQLRSVSRGDIRTQKCRTNYMKTSFTYYSKTVWNSIPLYIRNMPNIYSFKKHYKMFLLKP